MRNFWFVFALALILGGCQPLPPPDIQPPRLLDAAVSSTGTELSLDFDEPVAEATAGGNFSGERPSATIDGGRVTVNLPPGLKPGKDYQWSAEVKDGGHNLTSVAGRFYGPNEHPAALRLNEVRIAGSGAHTDLVELRVEAGGSLGGWTLDAYSGPEARQRIVLPDRDVAAGEFVVVHYKLTGDPAERDETETSGSGGSDADPGAWDFWQPDGKGLSAVKGLVALRPTPDSAPRDGLLYSRQPGEAAPMAQAAGWPDHTELNPENCTATRTWSRTDGEAPSWVLTANGGATPGKPNKLTPWAGQTSTRKTSPKTKGRPGQRRWVYRGPGRQPGPGSRPKPVASEAVPPRPRSRDEPKEGRTGAPRGNPHRPEPRARGPLPPIARSRGATARPEADGAIRRGGGEEEPPLRSSPSVKPRPPGTGPAGSPPREAATLFV